MKALFLQELDSNVTAHVWCDLSLEKHDLGTKAYDEKHMTNAKYPPFLYPPS